MQESLSHLLVYQQAHQQRLTHPDHFVIHKSLRQLLVSWGWFAISFGFSSTPSTVGFLRVTPHCSPADSTKTPAAVDYRNGAWTHDLLGLSVDLCGHCCDYWTPTFWCVRLGWIRVLVNSDALMKLVRCPSGLVWVPGSGTTLSGSLMIFAHWSYQAGSQSGSYSNYPYRYCDCNLCRRAYFVQELNYLPESRLSLQFLQYSWQFTLLGHIIRSSGLLELGLRPCCQGCQLWESFDFVGLSQFQASLCHFGYQELASCRLIRCFISPDPWSLASPPHLPSSSTCNYTPIYRSPSLCSTSPQYRFLHQQYCSYWSPQL